MSDFVACHSKDNLSIIQILSLSFRNIEVHTPQLHGHILGMVFGCHTASRRYYKGSTRDNRIHEQFQTRTPSFRSQHLSQADETLCRFRDVSMSLRGFRRILLAPVTVLR